MKIVARPATKRYVGSTPPMPAKKREEEFWCRHCDRTVPDLFWVDTTDCCRDCAVKECVRVEELTGIKPPMYMLTELGRANADGTFTYLPGKAPKGVDSWAN